MNIPNIQTILTTIFLLIVISYYVLLILPKRKPKIHKKFSSVTVIIPAHNEELYIEDAIRSVIKAKFNGKKEIIVVDDGSKDKTYELAKQFEKEGVKIIKTKHSGKSDSMNRALAVAKGDLIAIVDGDSTIRENALADISLEVSRKNVVAACCPVRVKNRKVFIGMWLHIAEIYYSLIRNLFSKINANITTPGPLSIYRKENLKEIGGFSTDGFSEDADVAIRLIRKGHKIGYSEKAIAETNMPHTFKWLFHQRVRFARGLLKLLKKHMQLNNTAIDIYTLPIFLFGYIQSIIMGSLTIYKIVSGYITYFASQGTYLNWWVVKFFLEWFSLVGFVRWTINVFSGNDPLTFLAMVGIVSTLLTYPLYFLAFIKYDKKIDIWHIIPFIFLSPFWLFIMMTQIISLPEILRKKQYNIWKKNE